MDYGELSLPKLECPKHPHLPLLYCDCELNSTDIIFVYIILFIYIILPLTKSQQKLVEVFSVIKEVEIFEQVNVTLCKIRALKFFKN